MSVCRVCMAEIVWCVTESGERIPLDEHEQMTTGENRWRIRETKTPPLIERVAPDFSAPAMVDHRDICQQPRAT